MLHSLAKDQLEEYVKQCVKERREEVEKKHNLLVEIRPEFKDSLKKTELLDLVGNSHFINTSRVMVGLQICSA